MSADNPRIYEFGPFRLDVEAKLLLRDGEPLALTPKAVETLIALVERNGQPVTRENLINEVWSDTFVEPNNLSVHVSALRKALGTTPEGKPYIETLFGRGYKFSAEVRGVVERRVVEHGVTEHRVVERGVVERLVIIEETDDDVSPPVEIERAPTARALMAGDGRGSRRILVALGAALLVVAAIGAFFHLRERSERSRNKSVTGIRSLAVLPLKPLGATEQTENYLGVGLADALITRLSGVDDISVQPTSAVLRFDAPGQDALAAGRALGVDAVLEGSYQREGERIRVTVQLIGARNGVQLWATTIDDDFTNIFAVQDSISRQVIRALVSNLGAAERKLLARRTTENVEAYQFYLKGRYFWSKRSSEGLRKSLQHFEQAVMIDPLYARAYAGLADSYLGLLEHDVIPRHEAYSKASTAAQRALSLDPALAEAHATLGFIRLSRDRDYAGAEREFKRAVELDPNYATARQFYGVYLLAVGRGEEAVEQTRRALEIDPLSLLNNTQLVRALYLAGRYDEAVGQGLRTLELDADSASARVFLGQSYAQKGMLREATAELEKAVELSGGRAEMKAALGYVYALSGRKGDAQKTIDELRRQTKDPSQVSYHIATVHAGFPDEEEAFKWLQKAYDEGDFFLNVRLKSDPKLASLRADPRYQALLRRLGLPPSS